FQPAGFTQKTKAHEKTISLNDGGTISDWASFESYQWPQPAAPAYAILDEMAAEVPAGMKLIAYGPGGVLENLIGLVGYESLCLLLIDDPALAGAIFDRVGSTLLRHYELVMQHDIVGAAIVNDDWGFKTQTMLSPQQMKQYVYPWTRQIVAAIHAAGRPAIQHSCGCFRDVIDDVIDDLRFDGRHSYEDTIMPVEEAYEKYGRRLAIMGGIDLDFLVRRSPAEVYQRSKAMLERAGTRGSYALGSGNSIPEYVPQENYLAMIRAAVE
ncbi:MAG: uroporphyrinogen decarboxylase family protein, partial [Phycisphaerae bacterium]